MSSFYAYEPTAAIIAELRIQAAEQIDAIDGGEECQGSDSRKTMLADLMEAAADRLESGVRTRGTVGTDGPTFDRQSCPLTNDPQLRATNAMFDALFGVMK